MLLRPKSSLFSRAGFRALVARSPPLHLVARSASSDPKDADSNDLRKYVEAAKKVSAPWPEGKLRPAAPSLQLVLCLLITC